MKTLGIIQPGRIGDIIICLPIAKHYHDLGYSVKWPISKSYINHFKDYIDYVEFIPITDDVWSSVNDSRSVTKDCTKVLELAFSYPNTPKTTSLFDSGDIPFDKLKYQLAEVPFEKKWSLQVTRNKENEEALYKRIVTNEKYVVEHFEGSGYKREINIDNVGNFDIIKISNLTDSIFDWLMVLERSKKLILIDSCFANLVEQLNLPNTKYFLLRSPYKITPTLKNEWKRI